MLTAVRASISRPVVYFDFTDEIIFKNSLSKSLNSIVIWSIGTWWVSGIWSEVFFAANTPAILAVAHKLKNKNFIVSESGIDIKNIKKIKEATNIKTFLIGGSILNSSKTLNYINKLYNS